MDDDKTDFDGSILGKARSNRVKRFVVLHPESNFPTIRALVRKAVDKLLDELGAE